MRGAPNLRKLFRTLYKKKAPTGNPNIPEYIREAKNVQQAILFKANAISLGEFSDDYSRVGLERILNSSSDEIEEIEDIEVVEKKGSHGR